MPEIQFQYGDSWMTGALPDDAVIVRPGVTYTDPPAVDPVEATRAALSRPLGLPPLREWVKPGQRVVIAFPDRVKGGAHPRCHRRVAIPLILEELEHAGVREKDITLLCAVGLHRKNTLEEITALIGEEVVARFAPDRLVVHDAEDPEGIVELGTDEFGDVVNVNRRVAEADAAILIGHVLGNPYGGYSGGYKMCTTGLTTWRSIRCHHTPATMFRPDFLGAHHTGRMRDQFDAIGQAIERGMGKPFFVVDAVLGAQAQVLAVYAGRADEVQQASWPLADERTNVPLRLEDKADVVVFGLPRTFHYGPGMGTNPILMLQAIGGELTRVYDVFREGGVVIAPSICDGWFNDEWFPSYRAVFERLQEVYDQTEMTRFEDEVARNSEWIFKYRYAYAYHPWHALSMVYMGGIAWQHASAILIPGARHPGYARAMGCIPTPTFADALRQAERYVGKHPRILAIPGLFESAPVHLRMG